MQPQPNPDAPDPGGQQPIGQSGSTVCVEVKPPPGAAQRLVTYAVCVGRSSELKVPTAAHGFETYQFVTVEDLGELAAMCIIVDEQYFTGPEAEVRLADLAWVAQRAVRHEELVCEAMGRGPVMPLPFGTLFSTKSVLKQQLTAHHPAIYEYLERVEGCVELGLRFCFDREQATAAVFAQLLIEQPLPTSPGARYLAEKRLRDHAERLTTDSIAARCTAVVESLEPSVRAAVERRITASRSESVETAAQFALLVPAAAIESLQPQLEHIAGQVTEWGMTLDVTGPWAPYSFCPSLGAAA